MSGRIDTEPRDTVCSNCGQRNLPAAQFCDRCGRSLAAPRARRPISLVIGAVVVLLVAGAAVWAAGREDRGAKERYYAAPLPQPTPTIIFADTELAEAVGERLTLKVWDQGLSDPACVIHTFPDTESGRPEGVYTSDCAFWEREGHKFYIFSVGLINDSDAPVDAELENFLVTDREERTHRPISIFDLGFETEDIDLPKAESIPANGGILTGLIYVDADRQFIPASLTYEDQSERLTITFTGKHDALTPENSGG